MDKGELLKMVCFMWKLEINALVRKSELNQVEGMKTVEEGLQ